MDCTSGTRHTARKLDHDDRFDQHQPLTVYRAPLGNHFDVQMH